MATPSQSGTVSHSIDQRLLIFMSPKKILRSCQVCQAIRRDRCKCAAGTPSSMNEFPVDPRLQTKKIQEPGTSDALVQNRPDAEPDPGLPSDSVAEPPSDSAAEPPRKRCIPGPFFPPLHWENVTCPGCGDLMGQYKYHPSPGLQDPPQWQCRTRLNALAFGSRAPHFVTKSALLEPSAAWSKNWVLQNKRFQCCDWDYFERLT